MWTPRCLSLVAIALLLATAGCVRPSEEPVNLKAVGERKTAPLFSLKDSNGATVTLADYKGKVVLLNFWATWCGPCKMEIPWFIEFEQNYKNRDFAVLGISFDDDGWKSVRPYMEKYKINYRMMVGDQVVAEQYGGIDSLPTSFLIDRQGRVAASHIGLVGKRDYQNEIVKLLDDAKSASLAHPDRLEPKFFALRPGTTESVR